ncbi:MAG: translation elongation factor Ts [Elusimicrobia bacterium]|nr:translation elongation factor Ts [Elusimicrobiota bacterium]
MTNSAVSAQDVSKLRAKCGAGFLDCKKALEESGGDSEKAFEILRTKGRAGAAQKTFRKAAEGIVASYLHHSGKVGVLLELNCETDFVAKSPEFQNLARELTFQIAAASPHCPRWIRREDVSADVLEKEKQIYRQQAAELGKPPQAADKIVEGKLAKYYSDFCLLEQPSIRDSSGKTKTGNLITETIAKLGENIVIRRFVRFQVGEETASS